MNHGFYIEVVNGLLDKKHYKNMGVAVWQFMWCLDRITKIDDDGIGWVLGGKPINLCEITNDIGGTEPKTSKKLHKLQSTGYINIKRTPTGIIISVNKAKKRFAQKVKTEKSDLPKRVTGFTQTGKTNIRQDNDETIILSKDNTEPVNLAYGNPVEKTDNRQKYISDVLRPSIEAGRYWDSFKIMPYSDWTPKGYYANGDKQTIEGAIKRLGIDKLKKSMVLYFTMLKAGMLKDDKSAPYDLIKWMRFKKYQQFQMISLSEKQLDLLRQLKIQHQKQVFDIGLLMSKYGTLKLIYDQHRVLIDKFGWLKTFEILGA